MGFKSVGKSMAVKWVLGVVGLVAVVAFVVPTEDVEAQAPVRYHHICYHNQMPYFLVAVPYENSPADCPEGEEYWNPLWDEQDNWDCEGLDETVVGCASDRHIDCEFTSDPGGV